MAILNAVKKNPETADPTRMHARSTDGVTDTAENQTVPASRELSLDNQMKLAAEKTAVMTNQMPNIMKSRAILEVVIR